MKYPPYKASAPLQVNDGNGLGDWFDAQTPTGDLLDVNVWVALADTKHQHHSDVLAYWRETQEHNVNVWFCRQSMLGLVRLLAQRRVMNARVLQLEAAFKVYESFRQLPFVKWMPETASRARLVDATMLTMTKNIPQRLWTDAHLAATAKAVSLRMVTLDKDFKRFELDNWLLLTT